MLFPPRNWNILSNAGASQPCICIGLSPIIESIVTRNIMGQIKRMNVANPIAAIEKTYSDLLPFIKFQINLNFFIIILSFSVFNILLNQFSKQALSFDMVKALSKKKARKDFPLRAFCI